MAPAASLAVDWRMSAEMPWLILVTPERASAMDSMYCSTARVWPPTNGVVSSSIWPGCLVRTIAPISGFIRSSMLTWLSTAAVRGVFTCAALSMIERRSAVCPS